jgi:hypothetical protein
VATQQQTDAQNAAQVNALARAAIKARAVKMTQQIYNQSNLQTQPNVIVNPRNVGLVLGFWVKVVHSINNGSTVQINLTDFGPANALSNIQFQDLSNNTRINTPGWHLHFVNSAKNRMPFGTAHPYSTGIDSPVKYGSIGTQQISAPANIAASGTGTVVMWYWVPLAYSVDDLRGCVYGNVVNATMQLILGLPGTNGVSVCATNATDSTLAMFVGAAAGSIASVAITNTVITVYQVYYDQLPYGQGGLLLPVTDLATVYELKQTTQTGITQGQDFPYQYANFRDFLSTFTVFVNTLSSGTRSNGADINYWALQSANFTNVWKREPGLCYLENRSILNTDFPLGVNYFESRQRPISTTQYGNMQLVLNASTAGAGAYELVGVEDFALVQTLSMAGSLAAS